MLYYHSGRKTLRVFRVADGQMIANYRVPSDLRNDWIRVKDSAFLSSSDLSPCDLLQNTNVK